VAGATRPKAAAFTCDAVEAAISTSFQGEILRNRPYSYGRNAPRLRTVGPNITYGRTGAHLRQSTLCPLASYSRPENPEAGQDRGGFGEFVTMLGKWDQETFGGKDYILYFLGANELK
jgi:hypothetical protein